MSVGERGPGTRYTTSMTEPSARFRVASDVAVREIDGGLLLVNLENGKTWKLNQVGAAVVRALDGAAAVADVAANIARQFAAPFETVGPDVEALIEELRGQGLVEAVAPR